MVVPPKYTPQVLIISSSLQARVVGETPTILGNPLYFCWEERGRSLSCQGSSGTVCGGNWLPWFPPWKGDLFWMCWLGEFLSASPGVHREMRRPKAYPFFLGSSSKITVKCIPYIPMYPKNRGFKGRFLLGQLHLLGLQSGDKPALVRESLSNSWISPV